jgi:hypothetical protein
MSWNEDSTGASAFAGGGTQFAATANGVIEGFATADGAASGIPVALSFGNSQNTAGYNSGGDEFGGEYTGNLPCISDYYALPVATTAADYYCSGSATITDGVLNGCSDGRTHAAVTPNLTALTQTTVIRVAGNLTINCDSSYSVTNQCPPSKSPGYAANTPWATAGGLLTIPSLYVETLGDIYISPAINTLDGVYIASNAGQIYTCSNGSANNPNTTQSTYFNACNSQLAIFGALVAGKIEFGRTYRTAALGTAGDTFPNAGAGANNAAEDVVYGPNVWLSDPYATTQSTYDAVTSLPPVL